MELINTAVDTINTAHAKMFINYQSKQNKTALKHAVRSK